MPALITFDPGVTTGWSYSHYDDITPLTFISGGQIPGGVAGFVEFVHQAGLDTNTDTEIVSENFTLRPRVKSPNLEPIRIEGAMTALLGPDRVIYHPPAYKALVPDHKLVELGFWDAGQRHQMDAKIHALAHMLVISHLPTIRKYWPENGI